MTNETLKQTVASFWILGVMALATAEDSVNFNRDIRPILSNKCFHCHGPSDEDRKEDLRLDMPDGPQGSLTPRAGYQVIKPGQPRESELWLRISSNDDDERMPPTNSHKPPLSDSEVALFSQWIEQGANYQNFWAFVSPKKTDPSLIETDIRSRNPIDQHVIAQLEDEGLALQGEADRRTLIRRVTFDLTGLPPTLDEISKFLNDESHNAYTKLVDQLLSRETYGEHMARYWADLVRLSDTNGMHKDFHREFSTYRDWLIRSFNSNLPFDEFVKYQVAGDLFENPTRDQLIASGFNRLHMIIDKGTALPEESRHKNIVDRVEAFGTAFLGLTIQCAQCHDHKYDPITQKDYYQLYAFFNNFRGAPETEGRPARGLQPPFINLTNSNQEKILSDYDGREQNLKKQLTAEKERQEDSDFWPEKFEKIDVPWIWDDPKQNSSSVDFKTTLTLEEKPEAAIARFVGLRETEVSINGTSIGKVSSVNKAVAVDVAHLLLQGSNSITANSAINNTRAQKDEPEEVNLKDLGFAFILEYRTDEATQFLTSDSDWKVTGNNGSSSWVDAYQIDDSDHKSDWTKNAKTLVVHDLDKQLDQLKRSRNKFLETVPAAMVMGERVPPVQATMLIGGAYDAPDEPVERNTPAFLPALKKKESPYSRLDLAEWLVARNHPLTARVAVNRLWQQFFGVGLVKTSEDFGAQGEWPSHPELLDDLAVRFMDSGWDVKKLVRAMVLSATYKQTSDARAEDFIADPENRNLARGSRYRMDAEMIRDQLLVVSDQLNRAMYGKSVKPPQPPGLWEMVSMASPFSYVADKEDKTVRRSFYTYWRRGIPPPQMTIMNAPSREFCLTRRERTNTPLQALLLMNEEEYFKAAKATAINTIQQGHDVTTALSETYEKITSQVPKANRLKLMEDTLVEFIELYKDDPDLTKSLTPELEDMAIDKRIEVAAWTMITHSLLNLELTKVRR